MPDYFKEAPAAKLREYQKKSAEKKSINHLIRCEAAAFIYDKYDDIEVIMAVFKIGREQAYKMVKRGKELRNESD